MPGLKVVVEDPYTYDKLGLVYCVDCAITQEVQHGVKLVDYKDFWLNQSLTAYMAMDVPSPVTS